jgi:cytochrome c biogenesis protein CcmG/thiol:disulfide interchange protein DsbE
LFPFKRRCFLPLFATSLLLLSTSAPTRAASLDLAAYRGKVVYLDFWASWCTPCHLSFPWMNDIQATYGADGLVILAVNLDRDRAKADEFLAMSRGQLNIVYDPKGDIAKQFNFKDMPTAILIGRDGKVHAVHSGFEISKENTYLTDVLSLLSQKVP